MSKRFTAPEFADYALALGRLTLAWNALHERLAALFWDLAADRIPLAGGTYSNVPLWIWHSLRSDRSQREILRAVLENSGVDWGRPELKESVKWLLARTDALAGARDDAVHSPLLSIKGTSLEPHSKQPVMPDFSMFNPKAMRLAKREVSFGGVRILLRCRNQACRLRGFNQPCIDQPRKGVA